VKSLGHTLIILAKILAVFFIAVQVSVCWGMVKLGMMQLRLDLLDAPSLAVPIFLSGVSLMFSMMFVWLIVLFLLWIRRIYSRRGQNRR
jgi:hypothetical protein